MNNSAVFVRLGEVRKHPNADRLQLTTIFGNQVVVGMNAKEGDVGIYFDSNLQLSEEFAKANDLIRRKDEAGNNAGGMFDANRKVRCQKLRGERSDGFFIELISLAYIGGNNHVTCNYDDKIKIGKYGFKVGDEFTEIGDHPICNKFVVIQRQGGTNQKVGKKKFKFDSIMFKEHIDTAQLSRNLDKIDIDKQMVITAKLHGCVKSDTEIETFEFGNKLIKDIVDNRLYCHIKAFDTAINEEVFVPIDDYYFKANDGEWYEIELENGQKITITGNNPVWLPELKCYRRADELKENDVLLIT